MSRFVWTPEREQSLRNLYPHYTAEIVGKVIGCPPSSVWSKAKRLGLEKSPEFLASQQSGRIQRGKQTPSIVANRFKPGQQPWNKGSHYQAGGRSAETRFKPGRLPSEARNYLPIGSLRISADGTLERKVNDTHPTPARRWVAVHRLVWEAAHGPLQKGHMVFFKPGQRTAVEAEITADKLECITRQDHMRRHSMHSRGPEVAKLVQLKGQITRQVNRIHREHNEQQHGANA